MSKRFYIAESSASMGDEDEKITYIVYASNRDQARRKLIALFIKDAHDPDDPDYVDDVMIEDFKYDIRDPRTISEKEFLKGLMGEGISL